MNELLEILKELHPDVDYENCTTQIGRASCRERV